MSLLQSQGSEAQQLGLAETGGELQEEAVEKGEDDDHETLLGGVPTPGKVGGDHVTRAGIDMPKASPLHPSCSCLLHHLLKFLFPPSSEVKFHPSSLLEELFGLHGLYDAGPCQQGPTTGTYMQGGPFFGESLPPVSLVVAPSPCDCACAEWVWKTSTPNVQ